jgi:hypothetical protein
MVIGCPALDSRAQTPAKQALGLASLGFLDSTTNTLVLTPDLVAKIARYVQNYGQGGFQGRLDTVLTELTALAKALEPMAA